jgi:hypothetical protein
MSKLIDLLFGLIAYVCVATVITLALVVGYLRHSDQLNNEKMFRLLAVMQDVDLQQMAAAEQKSANETPPEEPSLNEVMHHQQVLDRNFEVKQLALQRGKQAYLDALQQLNVKIERYDRLAHDWQDRLKQEQKLMTQQNVAKVVSQLEQVSPDVGKKQLMMWIDESKMDDAILFMSKMSENKLAKILKAFDAEEDLEKLHEIHQRMITSGLENSTLTKAFEELQALDAQKQ